MFCYLSVSAAPVNTSRPIGAYKLPNVNKMHLMRLTGEVMIILGLGNKECFCMATK